MKKSPERTRVCPECKRRFAPQGLKGHLRIAHGINPDDGEDPDREVRREEDPEEEPEPRRGSSSRAPRARGGSLLDGDGGLLS